jgi:hypothetical protein
MKLNIQESLNSCKMAINAKGKWSGEVKLYGADGEMLYIETLELAKKLAEEIKNRNEPTTI